MAFTRIALIIAVAMAAVSARAATPPLPTDTADIPVILLVDLNSGQTLASRQPDLRFVPASMTKVMTVYTALGLMAQRKLHPQREFVVDEATAREWNGKGTSLYLMPGERVTTDQLIQGITTVSANDAAIVLAKGAGGSIAGWAAMMNADARTLGMANSHFATPNGWPDGGQTYVTARDLTRLAAALIEHYPAAYDRYFGQRTLTWHGVTQQNHDPASGVVAGADGIKTGHTKEAGFNFLGSALRDGRRLVMVVGGAKLEAERASASRALLEWGFAAWETQPLFDAGHTIAEVRVQNGSLRWLPVEARSRTLAAFPRGTEPQIRLSVRYAGPLVAPVKQGAKVADLIIENGVGQPGTIPLYAKISIDKATIFDRLVNGLTGLFA